jgi:hypothetical protein
MAETVAGGITEKRQNNFSVVLYYSFIPPVA